MSSILTMEAAPQKRARLVDVPRVCWCGQDLEYAQPGHCPRCGQASMLHSRTIPMAPAV